MNPQIKGLIFAGITALFWGFLAIALKMASAFLDPVSIVWFRFSIAFSFILFYFIFTDSSKIKILYKAPITLIIAGVALGINYLGFMKGISLTNPNVSQILIQVGPITLGISGFLIFKEKINIRQGIGFLIAAIGLILFYKENLKVFIDDSEVFNQGALWIVIAGLSWTTYAIFQKKLLKKYSASELNLVIFGLPMLFFAPFVQYQDLVPLTAFQWGLLIFLGLNTLIAYGSLALALKYADANKVSVIITMNPILTVIIMALITFFEVSWFQGGYLTKEALFAATLVIGGATMAVLLKGKSKAK